MISTACAANDTCRNATRMVSAVKGNWQIQDRVDLITGYVANHSKCLTSRFKMLKDGDKAPDFDLQADDGSRVSLASLRGRKIVLFFYPKDDTSGCTKEACGFRDALPRFDGLNADVFGVNHGDAKSHAKFRAKFALPYRLLVDEEHKLSDAFGIWKEKKMFAARFMGIERTTVVIDEDGRIGRIFRKVRVDGHVDAVAKAVENLSQG